MDLVDFIIIGFFLWVAFLLLKTGTKNSKRQWSIRSEPLDSEGLSKALQEGWKPIGCYEAGSDWIYIVLTKRVSVEEIE